MNLQMIALISTPNVVLARATVARVMTSVRRAMRIISAIDAVSTMMATAVVPRLRLTCVDMTVARIMTWLVTTTVTPARATVGRMATSVRRGMMITSRTVAILMMEVIVMVRPRRPICVDRIAVRITIWLVRMTVVSAARRMVVPVVRNLDITKIASQIAIMMMVVTVVAHPHPGIAAMITTVAPSMPDSDRNTPSVDRTVTDIGVAPAAISVVRNTVVRPLGRRRSCGNG